MDSDRWRELDRLFHAASALPRSEQAAFLDREAPDLETRDRVRNMLDVTREGHGLRIENRLLNETDMPAAPRVGERVGAYELVGMLGRGGMGDVYRGRRADPDVVHDVAIKLLRTSAITTESVERFRSECRILARFSHPDIVGYIDSGMTAEGQPYLVMPLVEGEPITSYCEHHDLSLDQRLRLFRRVCDAVQFAHQNLVVHRDIKPSNTLVTENGDVRLLDFGIAKIMDDDEGTQALTRTGARAMTPEYASPEQIRGEPITTSVDVYGLGLLLYEVLTGHNPQRTDSTDRATLERVVCDQSPATMAAVPGINARTKRLVSGDLQTVVDMALRKDPLRRYRTAGELGEDIDRFMRDLPVRARPDTRRYRIRTFVRRNRVAVSAASFAILALATVAAVAVTQSRTATQERDIARMERDRARQVTRTFVNVLGRANPAWNPEAKNMLVTDLLRENEDDIFAALSSDPESATELAVLYANVYMHSREFSLADDRLARAQVLSAEAHGSDSEDTANILHMQAVMAMETDDPRASSLLKQAWDDAIRLHGHDTSHAAAIMCQYASTRPWPEALSIAEESLAARHRGCVDDARCLGRGYRVVGNMYAGYDSLDVAARYLRRALKYFNHETTPNAMLIESVQRSLAFVQLGRGESDSALVVMKELQASADERTAARRLTDVGDIHFARGDIDSAQACYLAALPKLEQFYGEANIHIGRVYRQLARVDYANGDLDAAALHLARADSATPAYRKVTRSLNSLDRFRIALARGDSPADSVVAGQWLAEMGLRNRGTSVEYRCRFTMGWAHLLALRTPPARAEFELVRNFYRTRGAHRNARLDECAIALALCDRADGLTTASDITAPLARYRAWPLADPYLVAAAERGHP